MVMIMVFVMLVLVSTCMQVKPIECSTDHACIQMTTLAGIDLNSADTCLSDPVRIQAGLLVPLYHGHGQ